MVNNSLFEKTADEKFHIVELAIGMVFSLPSISITLSFVLTSDYFEFLTKDSSVGMMKCSICF
jgi:hypothetical protein